MDARNPLTLDPDAGDHRRRGSRRAGLVQVLVALSLVMIGVALLAVFPDTARHLAQSAAVRLAGLIHGEQADKTSGDEANDKAKPIDRTFRPTREQLANLEVKFVDTVTFRPEASAEGRIALNEDDNVPVVTPYAGRVSNVLVRSGSVVRQGDVLLTIEATDMVQAENDYQSALNALNKASSLLRLDQTIAARQQELFAAKAVSLKDYQAAQNDVIAAQSDLKSGESTLQAVKNRLRLLGKTDTEIAAFEKSGTMSPETQIRAPISGTIVQRKVGIGQYLSASSDPVFVIGDLSSVWLVANIRESEIPRIRLGQEIEARVLGYSNRFFKGRLDYISAGLDAATRRLSVRAEVDNPEGLLRPEMFATFTIVTGPAVPSNAVPISAVVYEGSDAHVWVYRKDGAIESRTVKPGLVSDDMVQILEGLDNNERIVTRGALFIDRATSGDKAS